MASSYVFEHRKMNEQITVFALKEPAKELIYSSETKTSSIAGDTSFMYQSTGN